MFARFKTPAELTVDVPPTPLFAGDSFVATVRGQILHDTEVRDSALRLVQVLEVDTEREVRDSDGDRDTVRKTERTRALVAGAPLVQPGRMGAGQTQQYALTFTIPPGSLASVTTRDARAIWLVEAWLDAKGKDASAQAPVTVVTDAGAVASVADHPAGESFHSARLRFEDLSSRHVGPGEMLTGTLVVEPDADARFDGVGVELRVRSNAMIKNGASSSVIVARQELAGKDAVGGGQPARFSFSLAMPDPVPAATTRTERFTVDWFLRGVAKAHGLLKKDSGVAVELHVRSAKAARPSGVTVPPPP